MAAHNGLAHVTVAPCDGLADAIERSSTTKNATEIIAICARIACGIGHFGTQKGQIDTLILGCTYYPLPVCRCVPAHTGRARRAIVGQR